mmetsp:Transcript_12027/g.36119  ORF Transcript_12027/g.36119 Transcript_12027/m.36119 type:complete len:204 (-) Transcript_12027:1679-2290(-)
MLLQLLYQQLDHLVALLGRQGVGLVGHHHQRPPLLHNGRHDGYLWPQQSARGQNLSGVHKEDDHLGQLHAPTALCQRLGGHRALCIVIQLQAVAAHAAGGVLQLDAVVVPHEGAAHHVAGEARLRTRQAALLAHQPVGQRRLAHIGQSHEREGDGAVPGGGRLLRLRPLLPRPLQPRLHRRLYRRVQVRHAVTRGGGNGDRFA